MAKKVTKLPIPAPNHPELSATEPAIPAFLDRKLNGIKDNPAVVVSLPVTSKPMTLPEAAKLREEQLQVKKTRTAVRIEKLKAKQAGATKAMPLTGKAAMQAIVADAVANGKVKIRKIPASVRYADELKAEAKIDRQARKGTPAKAPGKAKGAEKTNGRRQGTKLAMVVALLTRKGGCTSAEVLKATGWPSVSMPQQAKAAGLKLVKDKKQGEVTRYRAA